MCESRNFRFEFMMEFDEQNKESETILSEDYILSTDLDDYTLEECLLTKCLQEILAGFDYNAVSVKKMCEQFGVNDVNNCKYYENLAKNSNGYLIRLLHDYATRSVTKEELFNAEVLKTLNDFQKKLWKMNGGKLACKLIKEKETGKLYLKFF